MGQSDPKPEDHIKKYYQIFLKSTSLQISFLPGYGVGLSFLHSDWKSLIVALLCQPCPEDHPIDFPRAVASSPSLSWVHFQEALGHLKYANTIYLLRVTENRVKYSRWDPRFILFYSSEGISLAEHLWVWKTWLLKIVRWVGDLQKWFVRCGWEFRGSVHLDSLVENLSTDNSKVQTLIDLEPWLKSAFNQLCFKQTKNKREEEVEWQRVHDRSFIAKRMSHLFAASLWWMSNILLIHAFFGH